MEELILIDGNSLLFKAFYATSYTGNYMVNRNGIPTNGVYGFARMVEKKSSVSILNMSLLLLTMVRKHFVMNY